MVGDQVSGVLHFFGAEPATVLGPARRSARLPREEDLARELMLALQGDQRRMARIAVEALGGHRLPLGPGGGAGAAARRFVRTAGPVAAWPVRVAAPAVRRSGGVSPSPTRPDRHHRRRTRPGVLRGPGRSSEVLATITRSAVRACSSSTTTPRTGPITSTPWRDLRRDFAGDLLAQHDAARASPIGRPRTQVTTLLGQPGATPRRVRDWAESECGV